MGAGVETGRRATLRWVATSRDCTVFARPFALYGYMGFVKYVARIRGLRG